MILLLHCNGTNGSTTFTDSSAAAKTVTANGNAQITTTTPKFGSGAYLGDGASDYLSVPHDTDFDWSGDFTVDCWIHTADKTADVQFRTIWSRGSTITAGSCQLSIDTSGHVVYIDSAGTGTVQITGTTDVADSTYRHLELSRSGSSIKLFVSGAQEGSTFTSSENYNQNAAFYVGIYGGTLTTGCWNGRVDELRVSKGIARHTAGFSVPTTEYS